MAPIGLLLKTVFEAIVQVFLLCFAGYLLARRGVLDKKTQKQCNRLNVSLFTPALLFSKVAFSLSPAKLRELWVVPVVFILVTAVSMGVSYLLGLAFRLKRSQRNFAAAAAMFMNSNSLPIALMQSLVTTVPGLKWGDDDTESAMLGRALSYLVLFSTLGMVLRWSYGVRLLSKADPEMSETEPKDAHMYDEEKQDTPQVATADVISVVDTVERPTETDTNESDPTRTTSALIMPHHPIAASSACGEVDGSRSSIDETQAQTPYPCSPTRTVINHSNVVSSLSLPLPAVQEVPVCDSVKSSPPRFSFQQSMRRIFQSLKRGVRMFMEFMTAPLWAALFSLIVALIQPLQHFLDVEVPPLKDAIIAAGNCSVPLTLIVLGAYFYTPPDKNGAGTVIPKDGVLPNETINGKEHTTGDESVSSSRCSKTWSRISACWCSCVAQVRSGLRSGREKNVQRPGETRTVVIAVASRMILTPMLLLPLILVGSRYDTPRIFMDPVFVVSVVLLLSSPTALTLAQITQAASGDAFEQLISRTIFWSYCVVTPPTTIIYVVLGLLIAKL
ncbi:hypothetical protein M0805_005790 [Coniferiporia weirii]|nr:hypothetical protein M0805_005790 [Coniferiporia weirii]